MQTLASHLAVAPPARDLDWLKSALQLAIAIEHAALLPYIAAAYSLKVHNYTAYNLLRSVAMEEMAHMATAANMLAAIGGKPAIRALAPRFPGKGLPGGAEPDLFLCLASLSKPQLANFMRLEAPRRLLARAKTDQAVASIGSLYAAIERATIDNTAAVSRAVGAVRQTNQIIDNIGASSLPVSAPGPVGLMLAALRQIVAQGEGSGGGSLAAGRASEDEASHYIKFAELRYGRVFRVPPGAPSITPKNEKLFFKGPKIPAPEVINLLPPPTDGYAAILALDPNATVVAKALDGFDQAYSGMMANLDDAWNGPAATWWPTLGQGVSAMGHLRIAGYFNIMKLQVPPGIVARLGQLYPDDIGCSEPMRTSAGRFSTHRGS